jgi:hypothetical protein
MGRSDAWRSVGGYLVGWSRGSVATYIARAVILHLHISPDRLNRHTDSRTDYTSPEDRVHRPTRQIVLQHIAISLIGSVRRHSKTPRSKPRRCHHQQQQSISNNRETARLADCETIGSGVRRVQPDCSVQADGRDDESESVQETEIHGCGACFAG